MAVSKAVKFNQVPGAKKFAIIELTLENPYSAGGYVPITAAELGWSQITSFYPLCSNDPATIPYLNLATGKVQACDVATGAEDAGDLSAVKFYILVIGY